MLYYNKIMVYIRKYKPDYIYDMNIFMLKNNNGNIEFNYWNTDYGISKPTDEQLDMITDEEIENMLKYKKTSSKIEIFEDEQFVIDPQEGSTAYIKGVLKAYKNGKWFVIQDPSTSMICSSSDVGIGSVNLTASQLLGGIIYGIPSGNKNWILPSSSSIVAIIPDCKIGTTIRCIFNNLGSKTRIVTIIPGTGMTFIDSVTSVPINKAEKPALVLYFRIDNVTINSESITIFYG